MRKKSLWQKRNNHPKVFLAFPFPRVTKNDFGFALPPLWVFEQVEGTRMKGELNWVWKKISCYCFVFGKKRAEETLCVISGHLLYKYVIHRSNRQHLVCYIFTHPSSLSPVNHPAVPITEPLTKNINIQWSLPEGSQCLYYKYTPPERTWENGRSALQEGAKHCIMRISRRGLAQPPPSLLVFEPTLHLLERVLTHSTHTYSCMGLMGEAVQFVPYTTVWEHNSASASLPRLESARRGPLFLIWTRAPFYWPQPRLAHISTFTTSDTINRSRPWIDFCPTQENSQNA